MPCASYTDPRLAAVYDALNPPSIEDAFHLDLAAAGPCAVLDMGCGTGRLASAFAARGHRVTGADPAPAMLAIARARLGGDAVSWILSDAAGLVLETSFDLVVMAGHVFQVFLGDEDVRAVLANLRRHLAPGGRLAFATRNPAIEEWKSWTPDQTHERVEVPGQGPVDVHYDIRAAAGPLVTYETHFRFGPKDVAATASTLRFMTQDEAAGFLAEAGLGDVTWHGDWDRSPLGPASPEIIAIARA